MEVPFSKYEGAGNDFIVVDMTSRISTPLTSGQRLRMCNRKTGIGADGVLVLQQSELPGFTFKLLYYNADGQESSLCGNGSRCSLAFAEQIGLVDFDHAGSHVIKFEACDGSHLGGKMAGGQYFVDIRDVRISDVKRIDEMNYFLNTGSPHHVRFVEHLTQTDVPGIGKEIRWKTYGKEGSNVNFVQMSLQNPRQISVRTFERGVEDETLACGTGAVASAIAAYLRHQYDKKPIGCASSQDPMTTQVLMEGGTLEVAFKLQGNIFSDIRLRGPVRHVFEGNIVV